MRRANTNSFYYFLIILFSILPLFSWSLGWSRWSIKLMLDFCRSTPNQDNGNGAGIFIFPTGRLVDWGKYWAIPNFRNLSLEKCPDYMCMRASEWVSMYGWHDNNRKKYTENSINGSRIILRTHNFFHTFCFSFTYFQ